MTAKTKNEYLINRKDKQIKSIERDCNVFITESTTSKESAIQSKMSVIEPKLLGIKLVNYKQESLRHVWVPNYFVEFDYKVKRNIFFDKSDMFSKEGAVAVVFDMNELHASHYDLIADGEIPLISTAKSTLPGDIIMNKCNEEEMMEKVEFAVQRQILWKAYKMEGKLTHKRTIRFYREAWEMKLHYKEKEFLKYAYLDQYGTKNERSRGLKVRLDNM